MARRGSPDTGLLPAWPRFTAATRSTMVLGAEPHVEDDPRRGVRDQWAHAATLPALQ
jgi:carboxylesterase type B